MRVHYYTANRFIYTYTSVSYRLAGGLDGGHGRLRVSLKYYTADILSCRRDSLVLYIAIIIITSISTPVILHYYYYYRHESRITVQNAYNNVMRSVNACKSCSGAE